MPKSVSCGRAQSTKNLAPLSGKARLRRPRRGSAATAHRRAAAFLEFSNGSPKQNTIRSTDVTIELNQRHSSSGCATTSAVRGDTSPVSSLSRIRQNLVVEIFEDLRLRSDVKPLLDKCARLRAHAKAHGRIAQKIVHPPGQCRDIAFGHQKAGAAIEDAFRYSADARGNNRYAGGRSFQQNHAQAFH